MEILDTILDLQWQSLLVKRKIRQKIRSLPDNSNINRISNSPNCFTMMASEIFKDKDMTFSAEYYDFKYQYKKICQFIRKMDITKIQSNIQKWIDEGYINYREYTYLLQRYTHNRIKLHPQVIKYLKELL